MLSFACLFVLISASTPKFIDLKAHGVSHVIVICGATMVLSVLIVIIRLHHFLSRDFWRYPTTMGACTDFVIGSGTADSVIVAKYSANRRSSTM